MKSLLWKEFRENAKWAAFPLLLFGGILAVYGPRPCLDGQFLMLVSAVAALFGGVLGFLQVSGESQGDRRALLLHRPLSASRIFLSKALVGTAIYLAALGLPLVANVVWSMIPGNIAEPFRWHNVLPWLADILTGLVYYFAGMLMAQRQGRWYGSRCLGFPAAFLASLLVWNVTEFWQAIAAILVCSAVMAVAAWGSFTTGGAYKPQPLIAKAALAFTLLMGLSVLSVAGKSQLGLVLIDRNYSYYHMDRGGQLLIVHHLSNGDLRATDLDGRDLADFQPQHLASNEALAQRMAPLTGGATVRSRSYRTGNGAYVYFWNETIPRGEKWFFVADQGRLVGYDSRKRRIGSIGPDGFALAGEPATQRFEGKLFYSSFLNTVRPAYYLAFPSRVYAVDVGRREVKTLFTAAANETVLWAEPWRDDREEDSLAFICSDQSVHVVDEAGQRLLSAPLAYDRATYGSVRLRCLVDPRRYSVWYSPSQQAGIAAQQSAPQHFLEYDAHGKKIGQQTVPGSPSYHVSPAQPCFGLISSPGELAVLLAVTGETLFAKNTPPDAEISPLSWYLGHFALLFLPDAVQLDQGWGSGQVRTYGALVLLSAAVCAIACFLLARRFAVSRARCLGWTLCGLLFGPVGLLLMLAVQEWPATIACHACGKPRLVDRDRCEHCGADQSQPEADGTEIFEEPAAKPEREQSAGVDAAIARY